FEHAVRLTGNDLAALREQPVLEAVNREQAHQREQEEEEREEREEEVVRQRRCDGEDIVVPDALEQVGEEAAGTAEPGEEDRPARAREPGPGDRVSARHAGSIARTSTGAKPPAGAPAVAAAPL